MLVFRRLMAQVEEVDKGMSGERLLTFLRGWW